MVINLCLSRNNPVFFSCLALSFHYDPFSPNDGFSVLRRPNAEWNCAKKSNFKHWHSSLEHCLLVWLFRNFILVLRLSLFTFFDWVPIPYIMRIITVTTDVPYWFLNAVILFTLVPNWHCFRKSFHVLQQQFSRQFNSQCCKWHTRAMHTRTWQKKNRNCVSSAALPLTSLWFSLYYVYILLCRIVDATKCKNAGTHA